MMVGSKAGVMTQEEIELCICSEWQRVRAGFHGGHEVWTTGILNVGISPEKLIRQVFLKFVFSDKACCV